MYLMGVIAITDKYMYFKHYKYYWWQCSGALWAVQCGGSLWQVWSFGPREHTNKWWWRLVALI